MRVTVELGFLARRWTAAVLLTVTLFSALLLSTSASAQAPSPETAQGSPTPPAQLSPAQAEPAARPPSGSRPQPRPNPMTRPSEDHIWLAPAPEISLLTFGPGDEAFFKFGHNAIRVTYPSGNSAMSTGTGTGSAGASKGPDLVYNFGTFRFDSPTLILDFLTGKFKYWLSVSTFPAVLATYRGENRDVFEQQLLLNKPNAWDLAESLAVNARPENRYYLYDYYRDNCSTRIRDAIDRAVNGALSERNTSPGQMSLRDHTLRLVADEFWLYVGLDIAMGSYIDQRETRYSEMFLPERLSDGVGNVMFSGVHGSAALVKKEITHYQAVGRPLLRSKPPARTWAFFQAGVAIGVAWIFLAWEAYRRRQVWAQAVLALSLGVFGLVAGTLGVLFLGLWLFTDHQVAFHNENILQCGPWALGLAVAAWGLWKGRTGAIVLSYRVVQLGLAASVLGLLGKTLPFMAQHNERILALFVPMWCGAFAAISLLRLRIVRPLLVPIAEGAAKTVPELSEELEEREPPRDSKSPKRPTSVRPPPKEKEEEEEEQHVPSPSQRPAPA